MTKTPNPGSPAAIEQGCTCPVIDNHYGEGFTFCGKEGSFWIQEGCPLHAQEGEAPSNN